MKDESKLCIWDYIGIIYNALIIFSLIIFRDFNWILKSSANLIIIISIILIVKLYRLYSYRFIRFIRMTYPFFLTAFYYKQAGSMIHLIYEKWFDPQIIAFENTVFGIELTLWTETFSNSLLTEIFLLGYFYYFPLIIFTPIFSYIIASSKQYFRIVFSYVLTFSISLPLYFLIPVEGPRWHQLSHYKGPLPSGFFVDTVYKLIHCCAAHGGAMPSTHAAISTVYTWSLFSLNRKIGKVSLPFYIALIIGTVWGRFHYLTDTIVGLAFGIFAIWISKRISERHFGH